jgi:hypothetical protein
VSMRDVKRCKILINWFKDHLKMDEPLDAKQRKNKRKKALRKQRNINQDTAPATSSEGIKSEEGSVSDELRAVILALALCYHTRLGTATLRKEYRYIITSFLWSFVVCSDSKNVDKTKRKWQKSLWITMRPYHKNSF